MYIYILYIKALKLLREWKIYWCNKVPYLMSKWYASVCDLRLNNSLSWTNRKLIKKKKKERNIVPIIQIKKRVLITHSENIGYDWKNLLYQKRIPYAFSHLFDVGLYFSSYLTLYNRASLLKFPFYSDFFNMYVLNEWYQMINLRKWILGKSKYVAWRARGSRLNTAKFLRTPFFIEHLWWLLLESLATIVNG